LVALATEELGALLGIQGQPRLQHIVRHAAAMPQYLLGHCDNVREIESRASQLPGLELAGNAYHGIGIPNCIQSGERAAARVLATLDALTSPALIQ
jgi:oxygen-dependent protoporphyrinogen oxidase